MEEVDSLQNMALTVAAVSLFHQKQPMDDLHEMLNKNNYKYRQKWTALEKEIYLEVAEKEIEARMIPTAIEKKLKCTIIPISQEILDWALFFSNTFAYKDFFLIKEFCWVSSGRIDGEKTVKRLLDKELLLPLKKEDILLRFKMAAFFCLKDEMQRLIKSDDHQFLKDYLEALPDFRECLYSTSKMLSLWSKIVLDSSPTEEKKILKIYFAETFKRFNCAAVKHFCDINEFSSREKEVKFVSDCLENLKSSIKTEKDFPKSYETNIAFYLLEKLNKDELEIVLSEHYYMAEYILSICTEYQFRDMFFKYKEVIVKCIIYECFQDHGYYSNSTPLLDIFKKMPQDPEFYKEMFSIVWKNIEDRGAELELRLRSGDNPDCEIVNLDMLLDSRNRMAALLFSEYYDDLISIMCSFNVETKEWFVIRHIEREPFSGFFKRFSDEHDKFERTKFVSSIAECLEKRKVVRSCEKTSEIEVTAEKLSRLMVDYLLGK